MNFFTFLSNFIYFYNIAVINREHVCLGCYSILQYLFLYMKRKSNHRSACHGHSSEEIHVIFSKTQK